MKSLFPFAETQSSSYQHGFTVIEMLVSIAIFGMLAVLIVANFKIGGLNDDLRSSAQQFAGDLRRVQNLATVGQSVSYEGASRVPPGGYGISLPWVPGTFHDDEFHGSFYGYTMFADFESSDQYSLNCIKVPNQLYDAGSSTYRHVCGDKKIEAGTIEFKPSIRVALVSLQNWSCSSDHYYGFIFDPVDITFKPPRPVPYILGCPGTVQFELDHAQTHKCRTVTVNAVTGQISERAGSVSPANNYNSCAS